MAFTIEGFMSQLAGIGFFEFLLPWLFVFAIVFGLLTRVGLFGEANKRVSGIIAIVLAFFITPFAGPALTSYFATLSAGTAIILAALLTVVLFAAMFGLGMEELKSKKYAFPIMIVIAAVIFFIALGGKMLNLTIGSSTLTIVFIVALVIGAIWYISGGTGGGGGAPAGGAKEPK